MKKKLAVLVTVVMLSFPVNGGLVLAEENTENTEAAVQGETVVIDTTTAAETVDSDAIGTDTIVVDADGQEVDAKTLPDSPLSWLKDLIHKIKVALTGDPIAKAQLLKEQASEDLAEATELVKKGKYNEAQIEKALTSYNIKVEKALTFLEQVEDTNSDEYQKLQDALSKVNTNNIIVLGGLLEKLPPQAAEKVALNIVRSMEKALAKADKMEGKCSQMEQVEDADADADTDKDTDTGTEEKATTETSTDIASADTVTDTQVDEEVDLTTFAKALGLQKAPQGNAYGYYYKHNKAAKEAAKAVVKNQQATGQTEQQVEQAEESQKQARVQKAEVKNSSKQNKENNRNHDKWKNGDRNRD